MRRRVKRDLAVLGGILAILAAIVLLNYYMQTGELYEQFDQLRRQVEAKRESQGLNLVDWDEVRATEGSLRNGGKFTESLRALNGQHVDIIGFMVPLDQFRDVTEFILLPVPIECYFCLLPPARDVILVQMAEGEVSKYIVDGPVLINGIFNVQEGETKYFYSITGATLGPGDPDVKPKPRYIAEEHMQPQHNEQEQPLDAPIEPPKASGS